MLGAKGKGGRVSVEAVSREVEWEHGPRRAFPRAYQSRFRGLGAGLGLGGKNNKKRTREDDASHEPPSCSGQLWGHRGTAGSSARLGSSGREHRRCQDGSGSPQVPGARCGVPRRGCLQRSGADVHVPCKAAGKSRCMHAHMSDTCLHPHVHACQTQAHSHLRAQSWCKQARTHVLAHVCQGNPRLRSLTSSSALASNGCACRQRCGECTTWSTRQQR